MKPGKDREQRTAGVDACLGGSSALTEPRFTVKERIVKDDGRYLVFYWFGARVPGGEARNGRLDDGEGAKTPTPEEGRA
jgi:hypothetical protein